MNAGPAGRLVDQVKRPALVRAEVQPAAIAHPVIDVGEFRRAPWERSPSRFTCTASDRTVASSKRMVHCPAVRGQPARVDRVGLAANQRPGKVQVEPVLLGVVGAGVDRVAVLPAVDEPGEVGPLALAADGLRRARPGVGRVVGAGDAIAFRPRGGGRVQRAGDHLLVGPRHPALVVDDMALVEVEHQDPVGERQDLDQFRGRRGRRW